MSTPCPNCLLTHQCICGHIPRLKSDLSIALLTHSNELNRDTNTGRWAEKSLPNCHLHIWQRTDVPQALMEQIEAQEYQAYVVFPMEKSCSVQDAIQQSEQQKTLFILLDGTWQEARKMYRKSPWLQALPVVTIESDALSRYQLRKNQQEGNLCTLEVVACLLRENGEAEASNAMIEFLGIYTSAFKADKSGHALKVKKFR